MVRCYGRHLWRGSAERELTQSANRERERERERGAGKTQERRSRVKGQRHRPRCVHKCTQSGEQTVSRAETQFAGKSSKSNRAGRSRARKWSVVVPAVPPPVFAPRPPRIFKAPPKPAAVILALFRGAFLSRDRSPARRSGESITLDLVAPRVRACLFATFIVVFSDAYIFRSRSRNLEEQRDASD